MSELDTASAPIRPSRAGCHDPRTEATDRPPAVPFGHIRHPIYAGLDMLAIGSAAVLLMFVGGDLRARAGEKLLRQVFGGAYGDYCARTSRLVPSLY